jgi:hypothetical protein
MEGLIFQVVEGVKEYRIYADGRAEGFAEGAIIINRLSAYLATAIQRYEHPLRVDAARECRATVHLGDHTGSQNKL